MARCRACCGVWAKNHYAKNKDMYVRKARKWNGATMKENGCRVVEYLLKHPCVDCGETDPVVLTFDHVRGKKRDNVANMLGGKSAWATI